MYKLEQYAFQPPVNAPLLMKNLKGKSKLMYLLLRLEIVFFLPDEIIVLADTIRKRNKHISPPFCF